VPLTFPTPSAARDDLDGLPLLGGQPTIENPIHGGKHYKTLKEIYPRFNGLRTFVPD